MESSSLVLIDSVICIPTRPEGCSEYALKTMVFAKLNTKNPPTKNTPVSILTTEPLPTALAIPDGPPTLTTVAVVEPPSIVIVSPSENASADNE